VAPTTATARFRIEATEYPQAPRGVNRERAGARRRSWTGYCSLREVEIRHIERVLQEARGNQRRASRILGISRWSLSRRLRKYGLQPRAEQ